MSSPAYGGLPLLAPITREVCAVKFLSGREEFLKISAQQNAQATAIFVGTGLAILEGQRRSLREQL
jgi:hypothetical protein